MQGNHVFKFSAVELKWLDLTYVLLLATDRHITK